MCACIYIHTLTLEREKTRQKAREHLGSEKEGTRVRVCVRLDVRVMGRVYVCLLHKSCLIHFDLLL